MSSVSRYILPLLGVLMAGPLTAQEALAPYQLKANDQIRLSVFQEPDLLTEVTLTLGGEASFPLIGTVKLGGLSLKNAEDKVAELYNADFLVEPKLSINLLNASAERVTVIGAVIKPGELSIPPNTKLDLVSAVDWAGGPAAHADERRVELKRNGATKNYDLQQLRARGAGQVILQHGDSISVPISAFANKSVMVTGMVKAPGPVIFPVSGRLDIETAIGMVGGTVEGADTASITVKRNGTNYSASVSGGNRTLAPGDIITVPASRFLGKFVTVMGQVSSPGQIQFPIDGKLDVLSAVARAGDFGRLANKKKVVVTRRAGERDQSWKFDLTEMAEGKAQLFYLLPGDTVTVPERRF